MKLVASPISLLLKIFIAIVILSGCGGGGGGGSPAPGDTAPPRAVSFAGEGENGQTVSFRVNFDEPVDPATVNDAHFKLVSESGEILPIQIECAEGCRQVILTPQVEIKPNVNYEIRVSNVTDLSGNPLPEPAVFSFKKEQSTPVSPPEAVPVEPPNDTTPPRIDTVIPDGETELDTGSPIEIVVKFTEPVDPTRVNQETFKLLIAGNATPGSYDCPEPCTEATFTPAGPLLAGATYQIVVTNGITDLAGNPLADPRSISFTTRAGSVTDPTDPPPATATNWKKQTGNPFNQTFYAIDAVSATQAWAVGVDGVIIQTTDAGKVWAHQESGTYLPLYGVDFTNAQSGLAVGGALKTATTYTNLVLKTIDGGTHWTVQTLTGLPGILKAVQWADAQHAWAVGGKGTILATADGGAHWEIQNSGTTTDLDSVDFLDASRGWAAGAGRSLLKTTDGGRTWVRQFTFSTPIRAIDFVDAQKGWAVGDAGALMATADGGASWQAIPLPATVAAHGLYGLRMNGSSGWAVGDRGTIFYYDGSAWTLQPNFTSRLLRGVAADGDKSWGAGDYGIVTFATAGVKGTVQNNTNTAELYSPFFINEQTGWTVGSNARIFRTDTGGATWTPQIRDWKKDIVWTHIETPIRLCNKDAAGAWIEDPVARDENQNPIPGAKYKCVRTLKAHLYSSFFLPGEPLKGWAVGEPSLILFTDNGGVTWKEQSFNVFVDCEYDRAVGCSKVPIYLRRVEFTDAQNGWTIGRFRTIFKTTDGGNTWKELSNNWKYPTKDGTCSYKTTETVNGVQQPVIRTLNIMGGHLFGLSVNPQNPKELWVGGGCCGECNPLAIIAHTADAGVTWDIQTSYVKDEGRPENSLDPSGRFLPEGSRFRQIQMMGNLGWAIGSGGAFVRTEDRGVTWREVPLGISVAMALDLFFVNPTHGWIVGEKGQLLKTEDGGLTWRPLPTGTRNGLVGVRFLDMNKGWISGAGDLILKSENGG